MSDIQAAMERYESEVSEAVDAAENAILEYYNGDRAWAAIWLRKAYLANEYPLKELVCDFHDGQPASARTKESET